MKRLTQADQRRHSALLLAMAEHGIPESRLWHVYHYQQGDDVEQACLTYLECRKERDPDEVANQ